MDAIKRLFTRQPLILTQLATHAIAIFVAVGGDITDAQTQAIMGAVEFVGLAISWLLVTPARDPRT